ncbi:hypothetical protein JCM24511_02257 [Saitozyma sp. JCM 24511]|nr:hypothetical protein JCM24511_02257 [Saitozyma sp. JCM 24511]
MAATAIKPSDLPTASVLPIAPDDEASWKGRYKALKSIVYELEDENNLIAYKIARLRIKIREKQEEQARLAEEQAREAEGRIQSLEASPEDLIPSQERRRNGVEHEAVEPEPSRAGELLPEDEDEMMDDY